MFPYIMMGTAFLFCPADKQEKILVFFSRLFRLTPKANHSFPVRLPNVYRFIFIAFLGFNLLFPWRYLLYPGELFWTEEGFRFSWRVMLIEKQGYAVFMVKDKQGRLEIPNNGNFLTPLQEKMMASQPDMMVQYAHILARHYAQKGFVDPEVFADTYVTLNGRLGKPFIDNKTNLAKEEDSFAHKTWILPFEDEIRGL